MVSRYPSLYSTGLPRNIFARSVTATFGRREGAFNPEEAPYWSVLGFGLHGATDPANNLRPVRCEGRPGRTEPLCPGLSEQTEMRNNAAKDLHDVHAIVDEMTDLQLLTDRCLVFPLQAETHMIWLQAGVRVEIDAL